MLENCRAGSWRIVSVMPMDRAACWITAAALTWSWFPAATARVPERRPGCFATRARAFRRSAAVGAAWASGRSAAAFW
ncbi:hypothetical protein ACFXDH_00125 [Streptomyces sp. NPDC059467]|uniref:hypothetical protein n=1 Tax=Streptomyces sp. NPDC059467 TaxID=3346844 RepID=UPI0036C5A98B